MILIDSGSYGFALFANMYVFALFLPCNERAVLLILSFFAYFFRAMYGLHVKFSF